MADPFTALGLASRIVQLITFASSLVTKTSEISKSTHGALVENLELAAIASNLQELSKEIRGLSSRHGSYARSTKRTAAQRQLEELCEGCEKVSEQLLIVIRGLKSDDPHVRWSSFRQALSSIWKEKRIEALSERLERYRRQIDTALLASIREYVQEKDEKDEKSSVSLTEHLHILAKKEKDSMSLGEYMRMFDVMDPASLESKLQEMDKRDAKALREYREKRAESTFKYNALVAKIGNHTPTFSDIGQVQIDLVNISKENGGYCPVKRKGPCFPQRYLKMRPADGKTVRSHRS